MLQIAEFFSNPKETCSYFGDRCAHFRYFYIQNCTSEFCQGLIERGWRRFGEYFFVPICAGCRECISIRQLVSRFDPNKSQKRIIAKNTDTLITITRPSVDDERLALYESYHKAMNVKKGWSYRGITKEIYSDNFVYGYNSFGYEITYRRNGNLVGVGYFDLLGNCISSTYFFYDHNFAHLSLGTFNILTQLLIAKRKNLVYFYPGYWIKNHYSMGYKEHFRPFEELLNAPDIFETPIWKPYLAESIKNHNLKSSMDSTAKSLDSSKKSSVQSRQKSIKKTTPKSSPKIRPKPNVAKNAKTSANKNANINVG